MSVVVIISITIIIDINISIVVIIVTNIISIMILCYITLYYSLFILYPIRRGVGQTCSVYCGSRSGVLEREERRPRRMSARLAIMKLTAWFLESAEEGGNGGQGFAFGAKERKDGKIPQPRRLLNTTRAPCRPLPSLARLRTGRPGC